MRALKMTFVLPANWMRIAAWLAAKRMFGTAFNSVAPGITLNGVLRRREV